MKLTVVGRFSKDKAFYVYVNDNVHEIDSDNGETVFEIPDDGKCEIAIEQIDETNNHTLARIIFYILTAPLQAIFRMFSTGVNWWEDAEPYVPYTDLETMYISGDTTITFNCTDSKYNDITKIYSKPVITVDRYDTENFYEKNDYSLSNAYFNYVKNIISCILVVCAIMIVLAVCSPNLLGSVICAVLAVTAFIISTVVIITQYSKLRKLVKANS